MVYCQVSILVFCRENKNPFQQNLIKLNYKSCVGIKTEEQIIWKDASKWSIPILKTMDLIFCSRIKL